MLNSRWPVLAAFGFSGAAALIYEVAWTRSLSLVLGSTTYALSTMLATFMAGLALGAWIGGWLADRHKNLLMLFGLLELGIGIFGLITVPLIHSMPPLYFKMFKAFSLSPSVFFVAQFLLCAGIMLVPTTLMGATFPIVSKKVTTAMEVMGKGVGGAYSFNTFGAIIGSLAAGFLLIPFLGVRAATITAASLNIIVAVGMIALSRAKLKGAMISVFIVIFTAPLAWAFVSEADEWFENYYTARRYNRYGDFAKFGHLREILMKKEFREGRVKAWRDVNGLLILQVGGKVEGTVVDEYYTILASYLPIASHPKPESMLVIGLGSGVTLSAAKGHVQDLHVVEINKGVVEAVSRFGPPGLLDGVGVAVNDGRNHLLLSEKKFDIIASTPSYPTESSSARLYTKEFFELAATKLKPNGIYSQWLPYYQLSNDDVTMMLRTFGSVFDNVYLWKTTDSSDLLMVGSMAPFEFGPDEIVARTMELGKRTEGMPVTLPPKHPVFVLSRTPEQVREIVKSENHIPLNTDDRPIIEFRAARNMITGVRD